MGLRFGAAALLCVLFIFGSPALAIDGDMDSSAGCIELVAKLRQRSNPSLVVRPENQRLKVAMGDFARGQLSFDGFETEWNAIQRLPSGKLYASVLVKWGGWFQKSGLISADQFVLSIANRRTPPDDAKGNLLAALPSVGEFYDLTHSRDGKLYDNAEARAQALLLPYFQRLRRYLSGNLDFGEYAHEVLQKAGATEGRSKEENTSVYSLEQWDDQSRESQSTWFRVTEVLANGSVGEGTFPITVDWDSFGTPYPYHWRIIQGKNLVLGGTLILPHSLRDKLLADLP